jgi:cation:H+ antiporter
LIWLWFVLCLAIILFAGTRLAKYGDAIAEKTGLGRVWIGAVLIAVVTTMPEMVTSVSSVALVGSPDLALGTLLGSCCFNILILAVLDVSRRRTPVLSEASPRHVMTAGWGLLLIGVAAAGMVAATRSWSPALGWLGIPSIAILVLYLLGMWLIFRSERSHQAHSTVPASAIYAGVTGRAVGIRFALAAGAVIAAGIWLSFIGDEISAATGLGGTFVGTLFLAMTTSAPELVVVITALRMGAIDLAVGDVLGANMLNMAFIAAIDVGNGEGSVLAVVSGGHIVIGLVAMAMTLLVIIGLKFRQRRKAFGVASWYVPVLIALYAYGAYVLFTSSTGL